MLTFPWRRRLAQDGALFGVLTRIFVESVERFYEERAARRGARGAAKSGAVTVVQRTSGDMRLNPHLHVVFLDGAYHEDGTELVWNELAHLRTREVGQVIEHAVGRMLRYLRRHGHLEIEHDVEEDDEPEAALCASALSGREPRHTSSPRNGSAGSRRLLRADPAVAQAAHWPAPRPRASVRPAPVRSADRGGHVRFSMSTSACRRDRTVGPVMPRPFTAGDAAAQGARWATPEPPSAAKQTETM